MAKSSSVKKHENILNIRNNPSNLKNTSIISFPPVELKTDNYSNENTSYEIEIIEIPVDKRMIFQFNKPTKLEFS